MQNRLLLALCFFGILFCTEAVQIRFLNACPDCGDMDFFVDGFPMARSISKLDISRGVFARPGTRRIEIRESSGKVLTFRVNVNLEHPITIAAINTKAHLNYYIVLDYDIGTGVEFFRGAVKLVNLCPNCPMLEGVRSNKITDIAWPSVSYLARTWYRDIPNGNSVSLTIREADSKSNVATAVFDIRELRAYTVFIVGDYTTGVKTIVANDMLGREIDTDGKLTPYTNSQLSSNIPSVQSNIYKCPM